MQVRRIPATEGADLGPSPELLAAAQAVTAAEVVTGSVVGRAADVVARASLLDLATGRVAARAEWVGPADSIAVAARQLAAQLLLRRRSEPPEHVGALSALPTPVLRAYLAGHALLRAGRYAAAVDSFAAVLRADSTNAFAALGLAAAADWVRDDLSTGRVLARAWSGRAALPPADRAYLNALAGRRFPATTPWVERIADWDRATGLAPDRAELWFGLGDALFHVGALTGAPDARARARTAFERALERDSLYRPALVHLGQLAGRDGDRPYLARLAARARAAMLPGTDSTSEVVAQFLTWRLAHAGLGPDAPDAASASALRAAALRWAALAAVHDARGVGEVAARLGGMIAADSADRDRNLHLAAHAVALARGRPREAAALMLAGAHDLTTRVDALRTLVLDALTGESPDGAEYAAPLAAALNSPGAAAQLPAAERVLGVCVGSLWQAHVGDTAGARRALARVPMQPVREDLGPSEAARAVGPCRHLLAATLDSASTRGARRGAALDSLDRLLDRGDEPGRLWPVLAVSVARLHLAAGDSAGALARLRRAPYFWQWPHYRGAELRLESALARALGDRVGAWCAARHLLALRDGAETAGEARALRAAVERLAPSAPGCRGGCGPGRAALRIGAAPYDVQECREAFGD